MQPKLSKGLFAGTTFKGAETETEDRNIVDLSVDHVTIFRPFITV